MGEEISFGAPWGRKEDLFFFGGGGGGGFNFFWGVYLTKTAKNTSLYTKNNFKKN
jgi:hypothetical protein